MIVKDLIDLKLANAVRIDGSEEVFFYNKLFDIKLYDWSIVHVTKKSNGAQVWTTVNNTISWHMESNDEPEPKPVSKATGSKKQG